MCGIGGFVDYERDARTFQATAQRMKRTLTPRGPDAEVTTMIRTHCSSTAA